MQEPDPGARRLRLGVLSDTHGYLNPRVFDIFAGVDLIIHAGDVGSPGVLRELETIAPVIAVAGNMDSALPELKQEAIGTIGPLRFAVGHKRKRLAKRMRSGKLHTDDGEGHFGLVVFGHDHMPSAAWMDETLWLDPGSASAPYEEDDGPAVALVEAGGSGLCVSFIPLRRRPSPPTADLQDSAE